MAASCMVRLQVLHSFRCLTLELYTEATLQMGCAFPGCTLSTCWLSIWTSQGQSSAMPQQSVLHK